MRKSKWLNTVSLVVMLCAAFIGYWYNPIEKGLISLLFWLVATFAIGVFLRILFCELPWIFFSGRAREKNPKKCTELELLEISEKYRQLALDAFESGDWIKRAELLRVRKKYTDALAKLEDEKREKAKLA